MAEPAQKQGVAKATAITLAIVGVIAGGGLVFLTQKMGWTPAFLSRPLVIFQIPGDPPITIGDGSIHVHSAKGWVTNTNADTVIQPNSATGDLKTGTFFQGTDCSNITPGTNTAQTPNATAFLWTDDSDAFYDLSPGANTPAAPWVVTITDNNGNKVTVTYSNDSSKPTIYHKLLITTAQGAFDATRNGDNDENNREQNAPSVVKNIMVTGAAPGSAKTTLGAGGWNPSSAHHPHFTLGFCYH